MPPKRRRSDPSSSGPSLTDASPSISNPPETPKVKRPRRDAFTDLFALRRYTLGSTSRSSAAMYLKATKNAQKAFKYECMCLDRVQDLLNHGLESKGKTDGEGEVSHCKPWSFDSCPDAQRTSRKFPAAMVARPVCATNRPRDTKSTPGS